MNKSEQPCIGRKPQRNTEWDEIGKRLEKSQDEALREYDEEWKDSICSRYRERLEAGNDKRKSDENNEV
ncbi:MAG: hypothetical protein FWE67_03445 [Planctomycetaceae bacterium]|nr:hypothetical protein [Planctomycetaceae bacterium]